MKIEYDSLSDNKTWDVVKTLEDKQIVGGKWVYSKKRNKNNYLTKYKARYVARGFAQVSGIKYYETFSPTARLTSIRVLMQISVHHDLLLHQIDVKTTYLNVNIDCKIYIKQPQGFKKGENRVCYLNKSIYGLKHSGRMWNNVLNEFLIDLKLIITCTHKRVKTPLSIY